MKVEKYVVVSTKPLNGTKVMCMATTKAEAEATKISLEQCDKPWLQGIGPYTVVSQKEAESKRLYGDS